MKPFSPKKRRVYFIFFCTVFFVGAPLFILSARGYQFNWSGVLKVSQTGGLYISTDQSGIEIYVNHILVKKTSVVQKSIFVPDLKPGVYEINVSKKGLQSWNKTLKVFPEIVTEARSFLIKSDPELLEIPRLIDAKSSKGTTSSKTVFAKNPEYDVINLLFLPPIAPLRLAKSATTSFDSKTWSDILVNNEAGELHVFWAGGTDSIPNYFCENDACKSEIVVHAASRVLFFDFFPGRNDLLILRLNEGIYVSEIDDRSPQNMEVIVSGSGYEFRVNDGKVYLKKDGKIYAVSI